MKYLGFVKPSIPGTKHAKVEIVSVENGAVIPDGAVLLENSRAKEFVDCFIAFDKIMHKGTGSAYVICSKIHKVDPPQGEETQPAPKEDPAPEPSLKLKPEFTPELKFEPEPVKKSHQPQQPDVEKLLQQISSLKDSLSKAELGNERLKKQIKVLKDKLDNQKESDKLLLGGEELFPGEKKDMVLAAIAEVLKGLGERTRRSDVLKGILETNEYNKLLEYKRDAVEKILKGYDGLSGTMEKELADLGLIISDVGAHYKIRYYGDPRYFVTMAKTPSDSQHGYKTLISKIKKKML